MEQAKIWRYFQTAHPESFSGAGMRLAYLASRLPDGARTLNIGVGSGQFERIAELAGQRVLSLDPDAASLKAAHGADAHAAAGLIQALPFIDEVFDVVVASEVVEHLGDDILSAGLAEIHRVLKPGGVFLGTVPFQEDLLASEVVCPHCGNVFHKVGHVRSYGFQSMREVLQSRFRDVVLRRKAFMNTSDFGWKKRTIGAIREWLVQRGILTRETSLVFEARKAA
jgi:SAM-dependent methyltransferase